MKPALRFVSLAVFAAAFVSLSLACGDSASNGGGNAFIGTDGSLLYQQGCASCHGVDLQGTETGPPFLHQLYVPGHHPDQAFVVAALTGARSHHWNFGDMPRVEGVTEEQVLAIVAFVRERQREAGFN